MQTDAQKRADRKYKAEKTKQLIVRFYPSEMELYNHVTGMESMQGYVKSLIRKDMEKELTMQP